MQYGIVQPPFDFSKGALAHLRNFSTLGDPNRCFRPVEQLQVGEIGTGRRHLPTVKEMRNAVLSISKDLTLGRRLFG
jgi:hypothetical protein